MAVYNNHAIFKLNYLTGVNQIFNMQIKLRKITYFTGNVRTTTKKKQ